MAGKGPLNLVAGLFDRLGDSWQSARTRRTAGSTLVASFVLSLLVIELNRQGLLPQALGQRITTNHFGAVGVAFTLLLVLEVLALVFALADSVADSMGKQFELLSLILLRKAFLEFGEFGEPIDWNIAASAIPAVISDMVGAALIFAATGFYYRVQRHAPITADDREGASFVAAKKVVASLLLASFLALATLAAWRNYVDPGSFHFFEIFFTVLVFSDVLIVLISLRYSSSYRVVFRNSGFAAATVLIRLALTAPAFVSAVLGLGAAIFALGVSLAYNAFAPELAEQAAQEPHAPRVI